MSKNPVQSVAKLYNRYMPVTPKPFSKELSDWLKSSQPKTIGGLTNVTAEKSFAILFMVMMSVSALPVPTGGFTTVLEIITILVALQLVFGRATVWLPGFWMKRSLGKPMIEHALPYLVRKIAWIEKYSRPRLDGLLGHRESLRLIGLIVILFTLGSFLAPPFSGLDTLPALGVLIVSLSLLLEDIVVFCIGIVVGGIGISLEIALSSLIIQGFQRLF